MFKLTYADIAEEVEAQPRHVFLREFSDICDPRMIARVFDAIEFVTLLKKIQFHTTVDFMRLELHSEKHQFTLLVDVENKNFYTNDETLWLHLFHAFLEAVKAGDPILPNKSFAVYRYVGGFWWWPDYLPWSWYRENTLCGWSVGGFGRVKRYTKKFRYEDTHDLTEDEKFAVMKKGNVE